MKWEQNRKARLYIPFKIVADSKGQCQAPRFPHSYQCNRQDEFERDKKIESWRCEKATDICCLILLGIKIMEVHTRVIK